MHARNLSEGLTNKDVGWLEVPVEERGVASMEAEHASGYAAHQLSALQRVPPPLPPREPHIQNQATGQTLVQKQDLTKIKTTVPDLGDNMDRDRNRTRTRNVDRAVSCLSQLKTQFSPISRWQVMFKRLGVQRDGCFRVVTWAVW